MIILQAYSKKLRGNPPPPTYCAPSQYVQCFFGQYGCWYCEGEMTTNITGCYCNDSGYCTSCYQVFNSCSSLSEYCQVGQFGNSDVGYACPYLENSNCQVNDCSTQCPKLNVSYDGNWSLSCIDVVDVFHSIIPGAICAL